jgi:hypothetical protein
MPSRLTITCLQRHIVEARVIDGLNLDIVLILRMPLIPCDTNMPFGFKRRRFPVRLAIPVTSGTGKTYGKICLYLPQPEFGQGSYMLQSQRVSSLASPSGVSETTEIVTCVYNECMNK